MTEDNFQKYYHSIFEYGMEAMLLTLPTGSIIAANPAAREMFQLTEDEICSAGRAGLVDESSPQLVELLTERARFGKVRGELTLIRGNGTKFLGEVSSAQFTNSEGTIITITIVRELSAIKQAELSLA